MASGMILLDRYLGGLRIGFVYLVLSGFSSEKWMTSGHKPFAKGHSYLWWVLQMGINKVFLTGSSVFSC